MVLDKMWGPSCTTVFKDGRKNNKVIFCQFMESIFNNSQLAISIIYNFTHMFFKSEIHSTLQIVLVFVLVNVTSSGGVNISLNTASRIWYDVINHAEWFTISILRITKYNQCQVYVCAK